MKPCFNSLKDYSLKTPREWSAHLYPGARNSSSLIYRTNRLLQVLDKYNEQGLHILEVGYSQGERYDMGSRTQQECWTDILTTYYPYLTSDKVRSLQLFNFDWKGNGDYSYPEIEPMFSFTETVRRVSS